MKPATKNLLLLSALLGSIFVLGCSSNNNNNDENTNTPDIGKLSTTECWLPLLNEEDAQCGTIAVPVDYTSDSNTELRQVGYAILPAIDTSRAEGNLPLLFFVGGPGPAATSEAGNFQPGNNFSFLRQERPLILMDYRGVGSSIPTVNCADEEISFTEQVDSCIAAMNNSELDIAELATGVFVQDADNLLAALNHEKALIYGASYGTRVALTMMKNAPQRISAVILDGVLPPEMDAVTLTPVAVLEGLNRLAIRCESNAACSQTLGNTRGQIEQLASSWSALGDDREASDWALIQLSRLAYHPAAPLLVDHLANLSAQASLDIMSDISEDILSETINYIDGEPGEFYDRPQLSMDDEKRVISNAMTYAVVCSEDVAYPQSLEEAEGFPFGFSNTLIEILRLQKIGPVIPIESAQAGCQALGAPAVPEADKQPVVSDIPTLVLNGGFDFQTPALWGELAAKNLTQSTTVLIPLSNHITLGYSECAQSIATQFLNAPSDALDVSCSQALLNDVIVESDDVLEAIRSM